ncbi:asparagine synthetase [glutamine-hydrolyzing] 1 [bacterium BMS3Abin15]|nr:asparagine synthetase [glutamine-hydrolyzing] 1 [bacterium BMS3Abin15]
MCGIAGAFNYKNNLSVSLDFLKCMSDELMHRGPDDEGFYLKDNVGFAFRRLSIIDLHTGNQPIHNEDKTIWVVFNGEIYNFIELRKDLIKQGHSFYTKSDTEIIVHLYEEYGLEFPKHLNGMYAIALWDGNRENLHLLRDRVGIKPLYYAETNNGILFSSEIKALLKAGVSSSPDYRAINQFLSYGYMPSPLTGFEAIKKLNAGHLLTCSNKTYKEVEFWDLNLDTCNEELSDDELVDSLIETLQTVLLRQTRSDVPIGIFLSAGIDSALIASIAAKHCSLKLNAFTVGYKEDSYSELGLTRQVAKRLDLSLNEIVLSESEIFTEIEKIISFFDEPLMDYSMIPTYFVSKLARSSVKTVIGGEGGDELFGGYQTYYLYRIAEWYRKIPQVMRNGIRAIVNKLPESHSYLSTPYKLKRFTYGTEFPYDQAHYRWKVLFDAEEKKKLLSRDFVHNISDLEHFLAMGKYFEKAQKKGCSIEEQLMYVDFKTFLQDDPLQKTDKMSMANSLEVRVPLLDNAIIDFSRKVSLNKKIKGFQTKYLLRKALSRFQPDEIAFGKKRGFTPPVALWLKNGLKDFMLSSLSENSLSNVPFLNHNYVSKIIGEHLSGKAENSRLIWALIVLVSWYKNYVSK